MRFGLGLSLAFHGIIVLLTVFAWPSRNALSISPSQPIPVELVTISDVTRLGPPPEPEVEPEPEPEPEPLAESTPEPVAEAPPPPPAPEPAPPPPPTEVAELKAEPEPEPEPEPKPAPKAPDPPPNRVEREPEPEPKDEPFDPSKIAALLDKVPESERRSEREPQARSNRSPRPSETLTISEIDAFKLQMRRCWSVPAGAPSAADLRVRIKVYLKPDGSLAQSPELINRARLIAGDPYFRAAAESAMRAIRRCQPFRMPADKYASWRELDLNFDPREMLGG